MWQCPQLLGIRLIALPRKQDTRHKLSDQYVRFDSLLGHLGR
jgi:hypothetical protein